MGNRVIFKYELDSDENAFKWGAGFKILSVQLQRGLPTVWVAHDTDPIAFVDMKIYRLPTGFAVPAHLVDSAEFIGTTVCDRSGLVWHWFARQV